MTFDIDANGILHVIGERSGHRQGTEDLHHRQQRTFEGRNREDAARRRSHAEEDKKAKEAIEIKNNADNLAYQSEKQLKELGDKISGDKKKQVEDAIAAVREAIERNDTDAMKASLRRFAEQSSRRSAPNFTNRRQLERARRPDHNQARRRSRAVGLNKAPGLVAAMATLSTQSLK